jgi:hypothetical protein
MNNEYDKHNKLHWLLSGEQNSLKVAKDNFAADFKKAVESEKAYCKKHNKPITMTTSKQKEVNDLLDRCSTFFEVEALARFIYNDNTIPTIEEVRSRGKILYGTLPIYDMLKNTNKPNRSY